MGDGATATVSHQGPNRAGKSVDHIDHRIDMVVEARSPSGRIPPTRAPGESDACTLWSASRSGRATSSQVDPSSQKPGMRTISTVSIYEKEPPTPLPVGRFGTTPFGTTPFGTTPFGTTPFGTTPFGTTPFGTTPFGTTPFGTTPFGTTPFGTTPFGTTLAGAGTAATKADQVVVHFRGWPWHRPTSDHSKAMASSRVAGRPWS